MGRKNVMRSLAAMLLILAMLTGVAAAEAPLFDYSDKNYVLPIDFTAGYQPKLNNMHGLSDYQDSTITVKVEEGVSGTCKYWVADIQIKDASQIRTMAAGWNGDFSRPGTMSALNLMTRAQAVVGLNGDFYDSSERRGFGYIFRQGILYRDNLDTAGRFDSRLMDVLLIDEDGDFHVQYRPEKDQVHFMVDGKRILNSFSFGPVLVDGGNVVTDFNNADHWIDMRPDEPRGRICLCQAGPLHYKVICCTGNYRGFTGMTMPEFATLAALQDVQIAYNLDGGDSVWLYFNGAKVNDYGSSSERKLMDIIYFASAEP